MTFAIFRNEVLAEVLNQIDPKSIKGQPNKVIGEILKDLILNRVFLEKKINDVSKDELKRIRSELSGRNRVNLSERTSAQIFIAAVINSDYQKIFHLIKKDSELKYLVDKDVFSEIQSMIAKNKRTNPVYKAARAIYKANPKISAKELLRKLQIGDFEDFEYKEYSDEFEMQGYKRRIKSSGIKNILNRIKTECN